jgi:RNA 3'-terminal phosphate cyclase
MSELKKSANSDSREPVAFVEIDGSLLEGGGQILRLSGSLACLLRKPIRVSKIRANRDR